MQRLFVTVLLLMGLGLLTANTCTKHLHHLASTQKDFVFCSTVHAVPVKLCTGCEDNYTEMVLAYENLRNEPNCSAEYFDKDRINIVSTTQSILTDLWLKAFCDDCFTGNHSQVFDDKSTVLELCLTRNQKNVCLACLDSYLDLNEFYKSLEKNVCYDLQDKMNRTRLKWSKDLDCCHREFKKLFFLIASGMLTTLPILFYGGMFAWTKRQERNHGVLNEDPEFDSQSTSTPVATANSAVSNHPNTSNTEDRPPGITKTISASTSTLDTDSEEELEPKSVK